MQDLLVFPSILNNSCLSQVKDLLLYIFLYKFIPAFFLVFDRVEFVLVEAINVFDIPDPVVDYTYGAAVHSCLHTTAAIVTTNNDMAYFKSVNSEIENTEQVQISVHNHVRDVSMHENFTWLGPDNDIGGYSTVRTPDP